MDELLKQFTAARVRCLLAGGQAMRLSGMPRFSMDWDFFIPPRDEENFARLNTVLGVPSFDEAERQAVSRQTESGTPIPCLSGPHLLAANRAANRPQDQLDIEFLTELERLGKL